MPKSVRPVKPSKKPLKKSRRNLPSKIVKKKPYFELATAFLSIPVLITVLLLNITSLRNINNKPTPTPPPIQSGNSFFAAPIGAGHTITPSSTVITQSACKKALGPVSITSPNENDTVTDNPVTINIQYDDSTYCGAAWSYRINGSSWSGYDDRSVALYNLPRGQITFELRVKSIVTADEKSLIRHFIYDGKTAVEIPNNPNSSGSAN
jgi:hypothetical protein